MMRQSRVATPACFVAGARALSTFNFGHSDLSATFGKKLTLPTEVPASANQGVKMSKMNNGLRVITHNRGGPNSSVGLYFEGGAIYDPIEAPGMSSLMRYALEGGNFENSLFQIAKTNLAFALNTENTEVRKRLVGLKITGRNDMWQHSFANLITSFAVPRFAEADYERFRDYLDNCYEELRWTNPREYVVDRLEGVAFDREALGNPRNMPPEFNNCTNSTNLLNQWAALCIPERMVLVGVDVAHDELVAAYENGEYPHSASAPHHARSAAEREAAIKRATQYPEVGQFRPLNQVFEYENRPGAMLTHPVMENECIAAVGFRTLGAESAKQHAVALVLQAALDQQINDGVRVQRHSTHRGVRSFYRPFNQVGLIGFTTRTSGANTASEVMATMKLLKEMKPSKEEVAGAAQRAMLRLHSEQLEKTNNYCDYLAGSVVPGSENHVPAELLLKSIVDVSVADVIRARDTALSTAPAFFATGDTNVVPSLRHMGFE